jgi:hypothetical protein
MIRFDHSHVMTNFHHYETKSYPGTKKALVNTICLGLEIHAQLEEEIFYPAMNGVAKDQGVVDKSVPEHDEMRRLIAKLRGMEPTDAAYDDTVMALMRDVIHHVADEETTLLPDAERLLGSDRLSELGAEMTKRRLQLAGPRIGEIAKNQVRAMPTSYVVAGAAVLLAGSFAMRKAFSAPRLRA